eukprot:Nitzschia sp. Nitz4//scaffold56_size114212//77536//79605//NITZ4_003958-RA/size114212-processed-gene-0.32-mRNA-1//-1//CDS//3329554730//4011//frame0
MLQTPCTLLCLGCCVAVIVTTDNDTMVTASSTTDATASQAWAILKRHARDEISRLRLQELCRDNDRVSSLVTVHNSQDEQHMVMVDLSRQRMTLETLNHLLCLARAKGLKQLTTSLAWGPHNDPNHPIVPRRIRRDRATEADRAGGRVSLSTETLMPSYHLALRAPKGSEMLLEDGTNVVTSIHKDWGAMHTLSDSVRRGQLPGITGQMIRDIVVVGQGVPMMALHFVYQALCLDEFANIGRRAGMADHRRAGKHVAFRRLELLTSVDPIRIAASLADFDPATTLVINHSLTGTEETLTTTKRLQAWLLQHLGHGRRPEHVFAKHMLWVTGNEHEASAHQRGTVFVIPEHTRCEPFCTFTPATLLPLAIVFGWPTVERFLQGAHDMDRHFVETNPRHNLPVLLALTDIWNDLLLQSTGRVSTPFTQAFVGFPGFCAALESQTCGGVSSSKQHGYSSKTTTATTSTGPAPLQVVDGGLYNVYDRSLYQSVHGAQPTELVMALDTQVPTNTPGFTEPTEIQACQDALICSMFAHADELAFGGSDGTLYGNSGSPMIGPSFSFGAGNLSFDTSSNTMSTENVSGGNRPSLLLLCGRLDAFACGQMIALAEHRAVVKAHIWGLNPFVRASGACFRSTRSDILLDRLKAMLATDGNGEEDEDDQDPYMNLSTKTILEHYSSRMRDQRSATNIDS